LSDRNSLVSSAVALSARALAAPAPLPTRNFVRLLLLGGATLALMGLLYQIHSASPALPAAPQQLTLDHFLDLNAVRAPVTPSVFMQEQAMPSAALMARWEPLIVQASHKFNVPAEWIRAVMRQESGGRTMLGENLPIVSTVGAMGIMQVMPETYRDMKAQYGLGADPYDPQDNIYAGTAYLKWLHYKYGYPAMFAAYNDGPGNIENYLYHGRALPAETRGYISGIAKTLGDKSATADLAKVALTQPDGTKVEIDARKVSAIHPVIAGIYAATVQSVITVGKLNRGIREDVTEATAMLRAHGAKI
jgi:soluble lytic murein transglycosylase-like protein